MAIKVQHLEVYTKDQITDRCNEIQAMMIEKKINYDGATFLALMAVAIGYMKKEGNNDEEIHDIFDKLLNDVQVMEVH